jgi:hypothetical protein
MMLLTCSDELLTFQGGQVDLLGAKTEASKHHHSATAAAALRTRMLPPFGLSNTNTRMGIAAALSFR